MQESRKGLFCCRSISEKFELYPNNIIVKLFNFFCFEKYKSVITLRNLIKTLFSALTRKKWQRFFVLAGSHPLRSLLNKSIYIPVVLEVVISPT